MAGLHAATNSLPNWRHSRITKQQSIRAEEGALSHAISLRKFICIHSSISSGSRACGLRNLWNLQRQPMDLRRRGGGYSSCTACASARYRGLYPAVQPDWFQLRAGLWPSARSAPGSFDSRTWYAVQPSKWESAVTSVAQSPLRFAFRGWDRLAVTGLRSFTLRQPSRNLR
jgi:hypothetical protein